MQVIEAAAGQRQALAARIELQLADVERPVLCGLAQAERGVGLQFEWPLGGERETQGQFIVRGAVHGRYPQLQLLGAQAGRDVLQPGRVAAVQLQLAVRLIRLPAAAGIAQVERQRTADRAHAGERPGLRQARIDPQPAGGCQQCVELPGLAR